MEIHPAFPAKNISFADAGPSRKDPTDSLSQQRAFIFYTLTSPEHAPTGTIPAGRPTTAFWQTGNTS